MTADSGGTARLGRLLGSKLRDRSWFPVFVGGVGPEPSRALALHFVLEAPAAWLDVLQGLGEYFDELDDYTECKVFSSQDRIMLERFQTFWDGIIGHITGDEDYDYVSNPTVLPEPLTSLVHRLYFYLGLLSQPCAGRLQSCELRGGRLPRLLLYSDSLYGT